MVLLFLCDMHTHMRFQQLRFALKVVKDTATTPPASATHTSTCSAQLLTALEHSATAAPCTGERTAVYRGGQWRGELLQASRACVCAYGGCSSLVLLYFSSVVLSSSLSFRCFLERPPHPCGVKATSQMTYTRKTQKHSHTTRPLRGGSRWGGFV